MTWTYSQGSGNLSYNGQFVGHGYSGYSYGRDNPDFEHITDVGPIPRGEYRMRRVFSPHLRPPVIELIPLCQTAHGRTDFRIHGDNAEANYTASHGCIIMRKETRMIVADSADDLLEVVR